MPIPPPSNPLIDLMYSSSQLEGDNFSRDDMAQIQKEQETRLLGTFMVQSIFLSLAIMLYSTWDWSQFGQPYEAALFYGILGFSLQASLYFVYRTMFEDSSRHRRELKRMRNKQKNKMAVIKFDIEKNQMEALLENQMAQYQTTMGVAMGDGRIDQSEAAILRQQLLALQATADQINQTTPQEESLEDIAKRLGLDRFRIGPIPVGPKLTISQPPITAVNLSAQQIEKRLDLSPPGVTGEKVSALQESMV
jgi:hypothetical protein